MWGGAGGVAESREKRRRRIIFEVFGVCGGAPVGLQKALAQGP